MADERGNPWEPDPGPMRASALHRELLGRLVADSLQATTLLAVVPGARRLAPRVAPPGLEVRELAASGPGATASWQAALDQAAVDQL